MKSTRAPTSIAVASDPNEASGQATRRTLQTLILLGSLDRLPDPELLAAPQGPADHCLLGGWQGNPKAFPLGWTPSLPQAYSPDIRQFPGPWPDSTLWLLPGDWLSLVQDTVAVLDSVFVSSHGLLEVPESRFRHLAKGLAKLCRLGALLRLFRSDFVAPPPPSQPTGSALDSSVAASWSKALSQEGFEPTADHGWQYAPKHIPPRPFWSRSIAGLGRHEDSDVIVLGAGLAGCAAAARLADLGLRVTLCEQMGSPAAATSSNPGGVYHSVIHREDHPHARFLRAASIAAHQKVTWAQAQGCPAGTQGILKLMDPSAAADAAEWLNALRLPSFHAQFLNARQASALAGVTLTQSAWWMKESGWVSPPQLCRTLLQTAAHRIRLLLNTPVASLQRSQAANQGMEWSALDASGQCIARATAVIVCHPGVPGQSHHPLLPAQAMPADVWVWRRGQISAVQRTFPQEAKAPALEPLQQNWPQIPLAGAVQVLPWHEGLAVFGATSQEADTDSSVRPEDHHSNAKHLASMWQEAPMPHVDALWGKTGFRCTTPDRLPLIGPVPDGRLWLEGVQSGKMPLMNRHVPRHEGLYMLTGLGSRGIGSAILGADMLAACLLQRPMPISASLCDAVDPARYWVRSAKACASAGTSEGPP